MSTRWRNGSPAARPLTITLRRDTLSLFARHTDRGPWEVGFLADLVMTGSARAKWSQERRRSMRTTLRGFYRWGIGLGSILENPADGLPVVKGHPSEPAAHLRRDLPAGPSSPPTPGPDSLIRLACECGLRSSQRSPRSTPETWSETLGGWSLVVHGKGGKARTHPATGLDRGRVLRQLGGRVRVPR